MADSLTVNGWTVRFRFRTIKKKRKVNGKTRGRYEGKYVYIRVTSPKHQVRDFYAGAGEDLVQVLAKGRGRKAAAAAPASSKNGRGRTQGKKAAARPNDTRDAADDRTLSMFSEGKFQASGFEWRGRKRG